MAFTQKLMTTQFDLANGQFGDGGGNTAEVTGLRQSWKIEKAGNGYVAASGSINGLPLSLMNQLSTTGSQIQQINKNGVSILAGDAETGQSLVWKGNIISAWVDAQAMPQVSFRITAGPGTFAAAKPIPPTSIQGSADASELMSNLASQMGFTFEDAGVTTRLANPYLPGTAWTQAMQIARHAGFDWTIDRDTLVIVPSGKARTGDPILISKDTGLQNYPIFQDALVIVRVLFNPAVKWGALVEVQSDLTPANGVWKVFRIFYELETMTPHGKWAMILYLGNKDTVLS